jgi:hypothetical protein
MMTDTPDEQTPRTRRWTKAERADRITRPGVPAAIVRFMDKVDRGNPPAACWLWTSDVNRRGYGRFFWAGKARRAHRLAYEWFVGPIPSGTQLHHVCGVSSCVRPDHLLAVTPLEHRAIDRPGPRATTGRLPKLPAGYRRHRYTKQVTAVRWDLGPGR